MVEAKIRILSVLNVVEDTHKGRPKDTMYARFLYFPQTGKNTTVDCDNYTYITPKATTKRHIPKHYR